MSKSLTQAESYSADPKAIRARADHLQNANERNAARRRRYAKQRDAELRRDRATSADVRTRFGFGRLDERIRFHLSRNRDAAYIATAENVLVSVVLQRVAHLTTQAV